MLEKNSNKKNGIAPKARVCVCVNLQKQWISSFLHQQLVLLMCFQGSVTEEQKLFVEFSLVIQRPDSPSAADKDSN